MDSEFDKLLVMLANLHRREVEEATQSLQNENEQLHRQLHAFESRTHSCDPSDLEKVNMGKQDEVIYRIGDSKESSLGRLSGVYETRSSLFLNTSTLKSKAMQHRSSTPDIVGTMQTLSRLNQKHQNREEQRFRELMELNSWEMQIRPRHILLALSKKAPKSVVVRWNEDNLHELIEELQRIQTIVTPEEAATDAPMISSGCITLRCFVNLMLFTELPSYIDTKHAAVKEMQENLLKEDIHDVVAKIGAKDRAAFILQPVQPHETKLRIFNFIVGCSVVLSLLTLGISLDVAPASFVWIIIESVFASVFILEIFVKTNMAGCRRYFQGPDRSFNIIDVCITSVAVGDILVRISMLGTELDNVSVSRLALTLRFLRLTRIARLAKTDMPLLKELSDMLLGFFIASRTLIWMMILLALWFYLAGVIFRITIGLQAEEDMSSFCPREETDHGADLPECRAGYLSRKYFGTVPFSCFTLFRCVLGDCTDSRGKSFVPPFSDAYGTTFNISYLLGMAAFVFGLFNIINSIFIENVLSGLKRNDAQKKYSRLYDAQYVTEKMMLLADRIRFLYTHAHPDNPDGGTILKRRSLREDGQLISSFAITKEDYITIVNDTIASEILDDLEVTKYNRSDLFDIFDKEGIGRVSEGELLKSIMMLRGEPCKTDVVQSAVLVRSLHNRIEEFQERLLRNQQQMLHNQKQILNRGDAFDCFERFAREGSRRGFDVQL